MQELCRSFLCNLKKPFLVFFLILFISSIVLAKEYSQDYIDPITYSKGDLRWCQLIGCTITDLIVDSLTVYNLSVIGDIFNVTMNLVSWNITDSFNVGGNLTADKIESGNITINTGVNANPTLKYREGTIDNGFDITTRLFSTNYLYFNAIDSTDGSSTRMRIRRTLPEIDFFSNTDYQNDYNITNLNCIELDNQEICSWDDVNLSTDVSNLIKNGSNITAYYDGSQWNLGYNGTAGEGGGADGLGNHTASEALQMGSHKIIQDPVAIGNGSLSTGTHTISIGFNADATGTNAIAIGEFTDCASNYGICIGYEADVSAVNGVAIGKDSDAAEDSVALGENSQATGSSSVSLGSDSTASAQRNVAIGDGSEATGNDATAIGGQSIANNSEAMAIGFRANTLIDRGIAIGVDSTVLASSGIAIGDNALANATSAIAFGTNTINNIANTTRFSTALYIGGNFLIKDGSILLINATTGNGELFGDFIANNLYYNPATANLNISNYTIHDSENQAKHFYENNVFVVEG